MFDLRKYRGVIFHDTEGWCKFWKRTDLWFPKWHEEHGKFPPEQLKVSKLRFWWDPLIQSRKIMSLKSTEEICVMTMKNDAKFEEKLTCCLENDMRNLANFHQSTQKCQNWNFDKILLSKVENASAYNLHWSYVSWQSRMIQKLKGKWLVILKLTWRTSQILTRALESLKTFLF